MEITVDVETRGPYAIVNVGGEVDVFTAPKLREQLAEMVEKGSHNIVVNLEGIDFLDSTGLGVLVAGLKRVKAHNGTLSLISTKEKILKLFRITGLTKVFPIHDTLDAATAAPPGEAAPSEGGGSGS